MISKLPLNQELKMGEKFDIIKPNNCRIISFQGFQPPLKFRVRDTCFSLSHFRYNNAQGQYQCSLILYIAAFHIEEQHHHYIKGNNQCLGYIIFYAADDAIQPFINYDIAGFHLQMKKITSHQSKFHQPCMIQQTTLFYSLIYKICYNQPPVFE